MAVEEDDRLPPAGLHPRLARKLLDELEGNEGFRALFAESPEQALRSIGYTDPWMCMALKPGARLASPAQIRAQRAKLQETMVGIQGYDCPLEAQEGY